MNACPQGGAMGSLRGINPSPHPALVWTQFCDLVTFVRMDFILAAWISAIRIGTGVS